MLFPFKYVPHQMERMQEFLDFTFFEVWCKAPIGQVFHPNLYGANPAYMAIMSEFGFSSKAAKRAKVFYKDIKQIYEQFSTLSPQDVDQYRRWYLDNNDLEKICAGDLSVKPVRYKEIVGKYPKLGSLLADFCRGLYDQSLLGLVDLKGVIGSLRDHYQQFFTQNILVKCPFCGVGDLKGIYHTRRDAYDHYLPKCRYPFNSINFRNLVPACNECNSGYKLSKDPVLVGNVRRKAFYPYSTHEYVIEVKVILQFSTDTVPSDITLNLESAGLEEEIETWKEVYGIEERYKAKFSSPDAQDWLEEFRILNRSHGVMSSDHIASFSSRQRYANNNFLKVAYLKACAGNGLLAAIEQGA